MCVSVCFPSPFTNFGTSVGIAVGLLEYSHAKKCNIFQNPTFSIFSLCFWNLDHKTKVAGNLILSTRTNFQRPNLNLEQCFFSKTFCEVISAISD